MTTVVIFGIVGFALARLAWPASASWFASPVAQRENHRGRPTPVGVGVLVVLAGVVAAGMATVEHLYSPWSRALVPVMAVTLAVVGFGFLGLVDDLLGDAGTKGLRGHLRAARRASVTTGAVKLVGGGAVALAAVATAHGADLATTGIAMVVADAALVALAANLANLFDRRPGRCLKATAVAACALGASVLLSGSGPGAGVEAGLAVVAATVGAGLGLLRADLAEELMLGDAGANPLGAAVGLGVVMTAAPSTRVAVTAVLLVLNLASEFVSFSTVIDRTPPLRVLDRWGRRA